MANLTPQIKHTYAAAKPPLSEFARFAYEGLEGKDTYTFVKANGPEAARQLFRYLTDLPSTAGCTSTEQFVLGYVSLTDDPPDKAPLKAWEELLAAAFNLAMIEDVEDLEGDGTREFASRMFPLMRDAAKIASPLLVAWGKPTKP